MNSKEKVMKYKKITFLYKNQLLRDITIFLLHLLKLQLKSASTLN